MALQFDQLNNQLKTNDSTNANASMVLTPSGTGSVLLNGSGQNLILRSSDLTNAAWTQTNITQTGSQADPFGGTTASLFNDGTTASIQHYLTQGFSATAQTYTLSCYAKAGTSNYFGMGCYTSGNFGVIFNLTTGAFSANIGAAPTSYSSTNIGNGWWRLSITVPFISGTNYFTMYMSEDGTTFSFTGTSQTVYVTAPQLEVGTRANTYVPTTTTAIYNAPQLSFSGVAGVGLQSDGSMYHQPAGTGALQAQATTSTVAGGNARGANSVDWQTTRTSASAVASGQYAFLGNGYNNTNSGYICSLAGGNNNLVSSQYNFIGGGYNNQASQYFSSVASGYNNLSNGIYNFIGGGAVNSGTSASAVTTQSATMNGTTTVTLAATNASIKVGQFITGTYITYPTTYVAAISGTTLTLSQNASGSGTATLSFFTPHGVVVGGGNNQATGSYSFIGGGGDAGTASQRNTASGSWSTVCGGGANVSSGDGAFIGGGGQYSTGFSGNTASGVASVITGGIANIASGYGSFVSGGGANTSNGTYSSVLGYGGTNRLINGQIVLSACYSPIAGSGTNQTALLVLARQTTDATPTVLASTASAASGTNQVILPNNSAYYFKGEIISGVTGGGNTKGFTIEGVIKRGANAAATTLVGSTVTSMYADAGAVTWTIALSADTTNGGLAVTFTGQAATTIRTVAQIRTTEMTF